MEAKTRAGECESLRGIEAEAAARAGDKDSFRHVQFLPFVKEHELGGFDFSEGLAFV
jgi:hypothetical protein